MKIEHVTSPIVITIDGGNEALLLARILALCLNKELFKKDSEEEKLIQFILKYLSEEGY